MTIEELLNLNRSYRRFRQDERPDLAALVRLVDLARLCPSAANLQPLKYKISCEPESNDRVFACLRWAAALKDWAGPAEDERPTGYVVILGDTKVSKSVRWDDGIAAQSILLAAVEQGLGGCMVGSIDKKALRAELEIPEHLEILLVVALGVPNETIVIEHGTDPAPRPYWRNADGTHHVPKRSLDEVLLS